MILQENEVCPLSMHCKYNLNNSCAGTDSSRDNKFVCEYVKDGKILDGHTSRLLGDKTGRMQVIID